MTATSSDGQTKSAANSGNPFQISTASPAAATLTGTPAATSPDKAVAIQVVGNLVAYKFRFDPGGTTDCGTGTYSGWTALTVPISIADVGTAGAKRLCVVGRDEYGNDQATPTQFDWARMVVSTLDLANAVKLSAAAPLFRSPAPGSSDCGRWLIGIPETWEPTVFINDDKLDIVITCRYDDSGNGGWHIGLLEWDGVQASATYLDADTGTAGNNERIRKQRMATTWGAGVLGESRRTTLVIGDQGKLFGLGYVRLTASYPRYAISAPSFAAYSESSYLMSAPDVLTFSLNDATWKGATDIHADLFYENGTIYTYLQTKNAPTNTTKYISVATSTDMATVQMPTTYLAAGLSRPLVSKTGTTYHMVAYNEATGHWVHFLGTSPTTWDFINEQDLHMRDFAGTAGAWDEPLFARLGTEPYVVAARPLGDAMYVFYMAGDFDYVGAAPYLAPRGIGVVKFPLKDAD